MEPNDALRSIESRLRLIIREVLGESWMADLPEKSQQRLRAWRDNDAASRPGTVPSDDLLDFTMTAELADLILANYEKFEPVFKDRAMFEALFGVIAGIRNTVAHSRELVPFERDLFSGVAGRINNQVAQYRGSRGVGGRYYPRIERLLDGAGRNLLTMPRIGTGLLSLGRYDIGESLVLRASSTPTRNRALRWDLQVYSRRSYPFPDRMKLAAEGNDVEFEVTLSEDLVGEQVGGHVTLMSDSRYHRDQHGDDSFHFDFAINPPMDED